MSSAKDDYFNKFNFTDQNAKDQELIVWAEKADVHDDWAEKVKDMLTRLNEAENPAPVLVLYEHSKAPL